MDHGQVKLVLPTIAVQIQTRCSASYVGLLSKLQMLTFVIHCTYEWYDGLVTANNQFDYNNRAHPATMFDLKLPFFSKVTCEDRLMSPDLIPITSWHEYLDMFV